MSVATMIETDRSIETRTATVWLDGEGIIRVIFHSEADEFRSDAEANIAAVREAGRGVPRSVAVDFRYVRSQEHDARRLYAGRGMAAIASAAAIVLGSPLARMRANLYLSRIRAPVPTRLPGSTTEALAWLRNFLATGPARTDPWSIL